VSLGDLRTSSTSVGGNASKENAKPQLEDSEPIFPCTLKELFDQGFPGTDRYGGGGHNLTCTIPDARMVVTIEGAVFVNSDAQVYWLGFYIPPSPNTLDFMKDLAIEYQITENVFKQFPPIRITTNAEPGIRGASRDAVFTRRIFLYYEGELTSNQKVEIESVYKENNLSVEFRGVDYLLNQVLLEKVFNSSRL
jgi:hypothetical protein